MAKLTLRIADGLIVLTEEERIYAVEGFRSGGERKGWLLRREPECWEIEIRTSQRTWTEYYHSKATRDADLARLVAEVEEMYATPDQARDGGAEGGA